MTDFTVRKFESRDAEQVMRLWQDALPSSQPWNEPGQVICRKKQRRDDLFFVGERGKRILATVMAGYDGIRGWIYALAVAPDCRRQGFGQRMLQEAEQTLQALGCPKINLQVRNADPSLVAFYEHCGFAVEDRVSLGKRLSTDFRAIVEPVPRLEITDQIHLSQITWSDKPQYLEHLNATDIFQKNTGSSLPFPYLDIDAETWISQVVRGTLEGDRRRDWAIRNSQDVLLGSIGLFDLVPGERAEIGYWLAQPYWGQGLMSRIVRRLSDFAFEQYQLQRLFGQVFATNTASARVLEKAGFLLEGTLRNHFFKDGQVSDVKIFGLTRSP